ncbi:PadR family transcriptional regulator [Sinosporangium siamense]|uniref:Transcriptional regulator n=1 Tax=Sinosporangium siamense TaxID=1367973 RepID=A0A919V4U0_9ACTN|nr:PadR family transcriptional regulator [Sinosporangium siamense]GII92280.1 transcriptional regulator [Sinosporangium siamense]
METHHPPWAGGRPYEGHPGRGFAPRVRRGDVRAALLLLLSPDRHEARNGYQLIQEIEDRSQGVWRPSPGSVYPALQLMEDEGLVTTVGTGGSRAYLLTEQGHSYVRERAEELGAPWAEVARSVPDEMQELRMLWGQVSQAFLHLTHIADATQLEAAKKLLITTRKSIFTILAEGDDE